MRVCSKLQSEGHSQGKFGICESSISFIHLFTFYFIYLFFFFFLIFSYFFIFILFLFCFYLFIYLFILFILFYFIIYLFIYLFIYYLFFGGWGGWWCFFFTCFHFIMYLFFHKTSLVIVFLSEWNIKEFFLHPQRREILKDYYSGKYYADKNRGPKDIETMASFRKLSVA